ncbi:helix-turn-helix domain-containing protein [Streptomyces sp. NPDC048392]|uniref:helix-turn-helix domain-containing protein n=1 Tax=Streptomyces sp. NPDC048392 TaxID=3365543 RepID=UPI00371A247D
MPALGSLLADKPELELTFIWPWNPSRCREASVTGLATLSLTQLLKGTRPEYPQAGALVLITGDLPFRIRGRAAAAMEELMRDMATSGCVGLVVTASRDANQPFPQALRDLSDELGLPLLLSTASSECWLDAYDGIQSHRLAHAERRANQLNTLLQQLPVHLTDPKAMQRIADWLAETLDAQVLISEPERVLAASPDTAAEYLAHAVIRKSVEGADYEGLSAPDVQLVSLTPKIGAGTVLAVASRTVLDKTDVRLLRPVARLLGLVDQARRNYGVTSDAPQAARTAAAELLLDGELDKARRVMASLAPGLLDRDATRAYVIQTPEQVRDSVVRRCEAASVGNVLVVTDPRSDSRILIISPITPGEEADSGVAGQLARLVTATPGASLGGSGVYSMSLVADAIDDAHRAQRLAALQPDCVTLSAQHASFVNLLPMPDAQRWARSLLRPLMESTAHWKQMRQTLPTALAYPYTAAARRLDLHRNTVMRHVARAAGLLGIDLGTVTNRIAVGLALEVITQREDHGTTAVPSTARQPTLCSLLNAPQLKSWAETLLCTARTDRRDLLATAASWLAHEAHIESAARMLGLSDVTVRSHLRALERHMSRDFNSLAGMRDLQFSLHILTGHPCGADHAEHLAAA